MEIEIYKYQSKLDSIFSQVKTIENEEISSHFAKYLCILTSGFIEMSLKILLINYAKNKSNPNIYRFICNYLGNITNLTTGKINKLLCSFSSDWQDQFSTSIDSTVHSSVGSVYTNRNKISHGQDVDLTYLRMKNYYGDVKKMIEVLGKIINP